MTSLDGPLKYDWRSGPPEIELIRNEEMHPSYCYKQCMKMCYYVQKMHNIEILKMRAEFARDDCDTIWFVNASQIHTRPLPGTEKPESQGKIKVIKYINKEAQKQLKVELKAHA